MLRTAPEQCRNHINTKGLPNKATPEWAGKLPVKTHGQTNQWRRASLLATSADNPLATLQNWPVQCHWSIPTVAQWTSCMSCTRSIFHGIEWFFNNHAHIINNYYYHTITITPEWTITKRVKGKLEGATINSSIWSLQPLACESAAYPPEYCKKKKLITTKQRICVHIHVLFTVTVHHHSPQYMYDGWRAIVLTECGASSHLIECERLILGNVSSILWIEKR